MYDNNLNKLEIQKLNESVKKLTTELNLTKELLEIQKTVTLQHMSEKQYIVTLLGQLQQNPVNCDMDSKLLTFLLFLLKMDSNILDEFVNITKDYSYVDTAFITNFVEKIKKQTRNVPDRIKSEIKYEQSYKCNLCQCMIPPTSHIDHIHPLYLGGNNLRVNLQALCVPCHEKKTIQDSNDLYYVICYLYSKIK
jgi:5-methylcytosine-specific restriction protein A